MTVARLVAAAVLMLAWWLLCFALGEVAGRAFHATGRIRRTQP